MKISIKAVCATCTAYITKNPEESSRDWSLRSDQFLRLPCDHHQFHPAVDQTVHDRKRVNHGH